MVSNPTDNFELRNEIVETENLANWIFWDNYYNCDSQAQERTVERLNMIESEHSETAVWGICVNWAQYLHGTLVEHYKCINQSMPPVAEILASSKYQGDSPQNRGARAVVQFISAISFDDVDMSRAIFLAAHDASREDAGTFVMLALNAVLLVVKEFDHGH